MVLEKMQDNPPLSVRKAKDSDSNWGISTMMTLYSGVSDIFSHRCRFVLHEKQMDFEVVNIDPSNKLEDISAINPYGRVPVLADRDVILYDSNIINEYIDERFPHPQLMPPEPRFRAGARQLLKTIEDEIFSHIEQLEKKEEGPLLDEVRLHVRDRVVEMTALLQGHAYLLGDELSILDVAIAPLLCRLDEYGIVLPKSADPIKRYAQKVFNRPGFIDSLTPSEKMMINVTKL